MAIAGYCSKGLNPLPSFNASMAMTWPSVASMRNGFAMKLLRRRKNDCTPSITAVTYGIMSRCFLRFVKVTTAA